MLPSRLSSLEIATISAALAEHSHERGPVILGAQLGLIIAEIIRPRTLREFGGLKRLADEQLRELVQAQPALSSSVDVQYVIRVESAASPQRLEISDTPVEVAGRELWRCYSNPRLHCQLRAVATGQVYVMASNAPEAPQDSHVLRRPTSGEYKELARRFAAQQQDPVKGELLGVLEHEDFYNPWIEALRRLRTQESNLLRQWEVLRSEHVAVELQKTLIAAGIGEPRAGEIVATARPLSPHKVLRSSPEPVRPHVPSRRDDSAPSSGIRFLRELVHRAVDLMSESELREIRIPAGLVQDAMRHNVN